MRVERDTWGIPMRNPVRSFASSGMQNGLQASWAALLVSSGMEVGSLSSYLATTSTI